LPSLGLVAKKRQTGNVRRVDGKFDRFCQYDYRGMDGELFSCVKPTLEACRAARDEWMKGRQD